MRMATVLFLILLAAAHIGDRDAVDRPLSLFREDRPAVGYLLFGGAAWQMLDPDGDFGRPVIAHLFGRMARRHDFVGRGWMYRKLQVLCLVMAPVFWSAFALTG